MDSFTLLKYWRDGGGGGAAAAFSTLRASTAAPAAAIPTPLETDHENSFDDGPFFDLEFPAQSQNNGQNNRLSFTMTSSDESDSQSDPNLPISPSDDVFFNGSLGDLKPQLTVSFLKPATRFRVLMLRLRRPKSHSSEPVSTSPKKNPHLRKFFVKFKVDEPPAPAPIAPLFSRESSSKNAAAAAPQSSPEGRADDPKEGVQKYLSRIKPLYVRVSKRYSDKLRFSAAELWEGEERETEDGLKPGEKRQKPAVASRLRVVYKHLRKSKLAAAAVVSSPAGNPPPLRDDSFLEQQDGIQSAIAHCKRSLTNFKDRAV